MHGTPLSLSYRRRTFEIRPVQVDDGWTEAITEDLGNSRAWWDGSGVVHPTEVAVLLWAIPLLIETIESDAGNHLWAHRTRRAE